ncbi:MAG: glycoside hydrolase family 3 C-terminal domain-containing protein [Bacteroidota bacterium]|nr:glycoside hydrolase family 3 C-terminal domain-containing protein [Bacteroidota bacterium]
MKKIRLTIFIVAALTIAVFQCPFANAQVKESAYLNSSLPVPQRVNDIISKLSLQQKIKLLMNKGTAIDSNGLKIPAYNWWNECLHGVARAGKATVFPQAIGLAATFDTVLMSKVANAISDEARAKHEYFANSNQRGIYTGLNFWTPNINIFRDPRWGRGMETYGEDPLLTSSMANVFIKGLQGNNPTYFKTIATIKHFVAHSGPEEGRSGFNVNVSDNDLWETYTPAFKSAVKNAAVYSLMCAYNAFRGEPCCSNDYLMNDLLRKQWGFKGFIVTDCGAVSNIYRKGAHEKVPTAEEASARAIKAGVDLECGSAFNALDKAIAKNLITEAELDNALRRLFTARFLLGSFDDPKKVSFTQIPYSVVESKKHVQLSLEAAQKSIVLLKNEKDVLPLKQNIKTLAVIGPNADDEEVLLANYNGLPSAIITPLEGLKKQLPNTKILYAQGAAHATGLPVPKLIAAGYLFTTKEMTGHGLTGSYYSNNTFSGTPVLSRVDSVIDFLWINSAPASSIDPFNFSVCWQGYLKVPVTGDYYLDMYGSSNFELLVDDTALFKYSNTDGADHKYKKVTLSTDKLYAVKINYSNTGANAIVKLNWEMPNINYEAEAIAIAKKADVVVLCMGLSPRIEGEQMDVTLEGFNKGDRTKLELPTVQQNLIKKIAALGKPVVLVLVNGSAVAINWEKENIPAIVETWYGGQQAGTAIANVLTGKYNPSGRLPVTFYTSETELPAFEDYNMKGRTYRYYAGKPLYEFGYGLSYTNFTYTNLKVKPDIKIGDDIVVTVTVQNAGKMDGDEVVQLYVENINKNEQVPVRVLKGFAKVYLKKGEKKTISFLLKPADFSHINAASKRIVTPDSFKISVGGKQPTIFPKGNVINTTINLSGREMEFAL